MFPPCYCRGQNTVNVEVIAAEQNVIVKKKPRKL